MANHNVNLRFNPIGQGGGLSATITAAWIEIGGKRVTEVPEGSKFDIRVDMSAHCDEPPWSAAVTCVGNGLKARDRDLVELKKDGRWVWKLTLSPMPDHDVDFTITPWANRSNYAMPGVPDWPPKF